MGPEAAAAWQAAAPYLVAGGTAAQMIGAQEQKRDRRRIVNLAQAENEQAADKGEAKVLEEAQVNLDPTRRMSDMQAAEMAAMQQAQIDLGGAGGATINTAGAASNVSPDFVRAQADRTLAEGERMTKVARELAKLRAPGEVEQAGALRRGGLAEALGSMWRSNRNRSRASMMDAEAVDMPGYGQLGQLAALAGMAGGMMGGTQAAGGAGMTAAEGVGTGYAAASGGAAPAGASFSTAGSTAATGAATQPWWATAGRRGGGARMMGVGR